MGRPRDDIERCKGKNRRGEPCGNGAGEGTGHYGYGNCKSHGGNSPAAKTGAARQMGREIIAREKRFGGHAVDITAEEALLEEVRRSAGMVRWLEEKIGQWDLDGAHQHNVTMLEFHDNGQMAKTRQPAGPELGLPELLSETTTGYQADTNARAWLAEYRAERSHLIKAAKVCIDAGIAQRLVRIAEEQGAKIADGFRALITALDLSAEQAEQAHRYAPAILTLISQGKNPVAELETLKTG